MELTLHVNDKLKLYSKTFIGKYHYQIVSLLYQPIIGVEASNLYFTLWNFFSMEKNEIILSHRQLLTFFNWDLKNFIKQRNKLEAIGLLNMFYSPVEGFYVYELRQPLTAKQFFQDSNLNVHLLYLVGDNMYEFLERKFVIKNLDKSLINITKPFEDVFSILQDIPSMPSDTQYVTTNINNLTIPLNYDFDYELFSILLNRNFITTDLMSDIIRQAVLSEAALYHFDAQMMSRIVLECVVNNEIDLDKLHEVSRSYYKRLTVKKVNNEEITPSMTEKQFYESINKKPNHLTNKEKALRSYKTKTPHEFMKMLQNNTEVPNSTLEIIKTLIDEYRLPTEVLNVLIEFVYIRNDDRLSLEYARAVASTWATKQFKTAEQAMDQVEKIRSAEKEYTKRGETAPTYVKHKRVVETPQWMKNQTEEKVAKEEENVDIDELKKLLDSFK